MSRYDCHKRVPPDLEQVFSQMRRLARRGVRFPNKGELRSAFKSGSRQYDPIGTADDLLRFLEDQGCVIQDGKAYYIDSDRMDHVLASCARKIQPRFPDPTDKRLEQLRAVFIAKGLNDQASDPDEPALLADGSRNDIDPQACLEEANMDASQPEQAASVPAATPVAREAAPIEPVSPALTPVKIQTGTVLFMDPIERAVWEDVCSHMSSSSRPRYTRPADDDDWLLALGIIEDGATEKALLALEDFVQQGLLNELTGAVASKRIFDMVAAPATFRIEPIDGRGEQIVTREELNCIEELQRTGYRPSVISDLSRWISSRGFELDPEAFAKRLSSAASPETGNLGILLLLDGRWHVTNTGFLPYRIAAKNNRLPRPTRQAAKTRGQTPASRRASLETHAILSAPPESLSDEAFETARAFLSGRLALFDADKQRREDLERQRAAQKAAALASKEAELLAQLAAVRAERAEAEQLASFDKN